MINNPFFLLLGLGLGMDTQYITYGGCRSTRPPVWRGGLKSDMEAKQCAVVGRVSNKTDFSHQRKVTHKKCLDYMFSVYMCIILRVFSALHVPHIQPVLTGDPLKT